MHPRQLPVFGVLWASSFDVSWGESFSRVFHMSGKNPTALAASTQLFKPCILYNLVQAGQDTSKY